MAKDLPSSPTFHSFIPLSVPHTPQSNESQKYSRSNTACTYFTTCSFIHAILVPSSYIKSVSSPTTVLSPAPLPFPPACLPTCIRLFEH